MKKLLYTVPLFILTLISVFLTFSTNHLVAAINLLGVFAWAKDIFDIVKQPKAA